jgi:hypothetical protein
MSTVVIVGAGGSLAQAVSYRPVWSTEHPPLDGNFFGKASSLRNTTPIRTGVDNLRAAIGAVPEIYDPWDRESVTMEQFFADVYYSVATGGASSPALSVFIDTLRLYRRVLVQTTRWMTAQTRTAGALDRLIRYERDRASGELTVITFNHDLVLESVASRIRGAADQWCLRSLYGDVDLRNLNWRTGARYANHHAACSHSPPFELLKLHGSLNWFLRTQRSAPDLGTLFPPRRTERVIYVANRRDIQIDPRLSASARPGGRSWYLWPLVVPPIYDKQRVTGMALLQQVWDRAQNRIEAADRLVLFGYSVPDADVLARQMLRTAVRGNAAISCVECINPDASVVLKLRNVLNVPSVRLYEDVPTYLKLA